MAAAYTSAEKGDSAQNPVHDPLTVTGERSDRVAFVVTLALLASTLALGISPANGKPRSRTACDGPGQCVVFPKSCCGTCGSATPGDAIAINLASLESTDGVRAECNGTGCGRCTEAGKPDRAHQLIALCEQHRCRVVDLGQSKDAACAADDECTAMPATCCGEAAVAVRKDRAAPLRERMCAGVNCPDVASTLPPVRCESSRCVVGARRPPRPAPPTAP